MSFQQPESIGTTRISDLPSENITYQMGQQEAPMYKPINVHPNPYGNSIQDMPFPPPPQYNPPTKPIQQYQTPEFALPSRDIPMVTNGYNQDEQIQPNFIPKSKLTPDFVKEYEDLTQKEIQEHGSKKHRNRLIDDFFNEFQIPILVAVLFFVFQLPAVNTFLFKHLSFLAIYQLDGNPNFYGFLVKSILFGGVFYLAENLYK